MRMTLNDGRKFMTDAEYKERWKKVWDDHLECPECKRLYAQWSADLEKDQFADFNRLSISPCMVICKIHRPEYSLCAETQHRMERRENLKSFIKYNPKYFKKYGKSYRQNHEEYFKKYKKKYWKTHKEYNKKYMREYMREYRKRKKGAKAL